MSADQELAATGTTGVIPLLLAGVALMLGGIGLLWRKVAQRSAGAAE